MQAYPNAMYWNKVMPPLNNLTATSSHLQPPPAISSHLKSSQVISRHLYGHNFRQLTQLTQHAIYAGPFGTGVIVPYHVAGLQ